MRPKRLNQKLLNDEAGITLVELLAAISILSIVILLAGSIHIFGQRQFIEQTKSASHANDLSYAMTVMTTDLRKKESGKIKVENGNEIHIDGSQVFYIVNNQLFKEGEILANNVGNQAFIKDEEGITITLKTVEPVKPQKKYETRIYFRR